MASLYVVDRNLVIRFGKITYQFHRRLENGQILQFENQITGEYKTFGLSEFHNKVQTGVLIPILGVQDSRLLNDEGKPAERILDISALSPNVQEELGFRLSLIRFLKKKSIRRGQRSKVATSIIEFFSSVRKKSDPSIKLPTKLPSPSTVMGWMRRFEESGRNVVSLLSGNLQRKRETRVHPEVESAMTWALDKFYLTRKQLSLQTTLDNLRTEMKALVNKGIVPADQSIVSMATLQRRKEDLDPYMVATRRYGQVAAAHKFRVTMDGTTVTRAMQRYEIDHTLLNWVVICDRSGLPLGRPTLTIVIDSYSGYIAGLYVSFNGPGLTSVINVLKNAIRPKDDLVLAAGAVNPWIASGIPDSAILDNGMEFHSHAFKLIGWELGIDLEYCPVRKPWVKPHVERFFATLDYLTLHEGRIYKPVANVLRIDPKKDAAISLSELCKGLVLFCCDIHGRNPNSRTLELPYDRFAESLERNPPPSLPVSMSSLDMIAAMSKSKTIAHGGVEFFGLNYTGYPLKEMIESAGGKFTSLIKWDPDDMGNMFVQHPRSHEWVNLTCTRPDYASGLTWNQHRNIRSFVRTDIKRQGNVDELLRGKERLIQIWNEPLARKNKTLEAESARKYAGKCTSALGFVESNPIDKPNLCNKSVKLIAEEEFTFDTTEIPQFETFHL